jgi:hypothetical protein
VCDVTTVFPAKLQLLYQKRTIVYLQYIKYTGKPEVPGHTGYLEKYGKL